MKQVLVKTYDAPKFCESEILRYAGAKNPDDSLSSLIGKCIEEAKDAFSYKVCYTELDVNINDALCDFGVFKVNSKNLAKNLAGCKKVILFAATVGVEIDRLIIKYGRLSPAKSLIFQAIGAERIESLCDLFSRDISDGKKTRPRFSPGYGDLSIEVQKDIFKIIDAPRKIGLSLNDSMLMSPTKSVTAFIGINEE